MEERPDEPEISQQMDPGKFASVQKFLEGQETRSVTTETSDSDYWTETTVSELGIGETIGKYNSTIFILVKSAVTYE